MPTSQRLGRTLHLIDIDGLAGTGGAASSAVVAGLAQVRMHAWPHGRDQQVLASRPGLFAATAWSWPPGARRLLGHGLRGSARALLEVLTAEDIASRFDHLVLASGDGMFRAAVASLAGRGVPTTVIAQEHGLSRGLQMAASHHVLLARGLAPCAGLEAS